MGIVIHYEGRTDIGCLRRRNEDAWGAAALASCAGGCILVVADGMGGHPGGDVASRLAVESCLEDGRRVEAPSSGEVRLAAMFQDAQARMSEYAGLHPSLTHMGTTLTVLLIQDDGAWVGSVGDSRLLWLRGGSLRLFTEDHNAAWELVVSGQLDADEAERAPEGSLLTRFLGPLVPCQPDISELPLALAAGDRLLLCTDGLGKALSMAEIAQVSSQPEIDGAVQQALDRSLAAGAPDNVTLILAEVVEPAAIPGPAMSWETVPYCWDAGGTRSH
jgi:PPM family protein phosphatase